MKKILYIFIALILVACNAEPTHVKNGRKIYEAYFQKYLKDPSSFKVYDEKYTADGARVNWTLDYGAKNGWGAMDRETVTFETIGSMIFINGHAYNMGKE